MLYNTGMLYYNVQLLNDLLEDIGVLVGTSVTFFDNDFVSTKAFSKNFTNPLCWKIKETKIADCILSDKKIFEMLSKDRKSIFYSCHFGLSECAFKLSLRSDNLGYIIIGPFRDSAKKEENLATIRALCEQNGYDYEQLVDFYYQIPEFDEEKLSSLQKVVNTLCDYAISKKLITAKDDFFSSFIEPFIQENISDDLSVESLCARFFLSRKQLYKIFVQSSGSSPKKYVNGKRILKAKDLIISTDLPLSRIAEMVGIYDYNYFVKIFKAYDAGRTPMFYRKKKSKT